MKFTQKFFGVLLAALMVLIPLSTTAMAANSADDDDMNMYQNSDFIEKEQPELDEETKQ